MKKLLTTVAVLATLVTAAHADDKKPNPISHVTGQSWLENCNSRETRWQTYCWAYARAVADVAMVWAAVGEGPFCIDKT